ncbi:MAG TPA: magnesium/cobalt transporter CorA [Ignavibacteriaceae bacterium]|nr:magnesium/cobalt transporter CorA [Ignavibacteriaceae bacterium]
MIHHDTKQRGQSPGTLTFTGKQKVDRTKISVFDYNDNSYVEKEITSLDDLKELKFDNKITWINITGLHDINALEKVGRVFNIHPLVLEDILNITQFPKIENYDDYLFVVAKMIDLSPVKSINIEQVSFILSKNYLISFQEDEQDVFDIIRERIRKNLGRIRKLGTDYLMYRLLDAIVDNYFFILENFDDRIDKLEDKVLLNPDHVDINSIYIVRKEIMNLRRAIMPMRDMMYSVEKEKDRHITKSTYFFFRDLNDHLNQIFDSLESYREMINQLVELYISNSSHKLNEVIKLLTIISTIFIPLTFIVGVYGMNFNTKISPFNMPELNWYWGYPAIMVFMLAIGVGLIFFFKRKKWM